MRFFLLVSIFLLASWSISAQTTFTTSGVWSNPSNWSNGIPGSADAVTIASGVTVTVDGEAQCGSLTFASNTANTTININTGITLTVNGDITYSNPTGAFDQTINVNDGNLICSNVSMPEATNAASNLDLRLVAGTITINGNLTMSTLTAAKNRLVYTGAGQVNLAGNFSAGVGTLTTFTGSTFTYNGASAQVVKTGTYSNLTFSGVGLKTATGAITVGLVFNINAGASFTTNNGITVNGTTTINGSFTKTSTPGSSIFDNLTIGATGSFNMSGNDACTVTEGGINNNGTFTSGTGTWTFTTANQTLTGSPINFTGSVTVTGITLINSTTTTIGGNLTGTGTLENAAGQSLTLNGATNAISALTATAAGNTVTYGRGGAQSAVGTSYRTLVISGSGTKTAGANTSIINALTLSAGTFSMSTFQLIDGGAFVHSGTGTLQTAHVATTTPIPAGKTWTGTVQYNSASAQTVVHGTFTNLTISGGNRTLSSGGTIAISGIYTPGTGTLTVTGSTIEFNGSASQTIPAAQYNNIVSSNTGARVLINGGTILIAGTFTRGTNTYTVTGNTINYNGGVDQNVTSGTYNNFTITDGFVKTLAGTTTISGILTLTSGVLAIGANTLTLSSTVTSTSTNCIRGNGSSSLTLSGSGNTTIHFDQTTPGTTNRIETLIINRSGTTIITLGNNLVVNTALTLTNGDIAPASNTLTINGSITSSATNAIRGNGTGSNLVFGGATTSSFFVDQTTSGTTNRFANITVNRSGATLTVGNALQVTGNLTLTEGTLAAGNNLTLISDATATACVLPTNGTTTGNITVQRFVPAVARRFRFLSSPAASRTIADWQGEIFITGVGGSTNGFDATTSNKPTVYTYTESTSGVNSLGWTEATSNANAITVGRGFRVFVRGDRSNANRLNDTEPTQNAVTINVVGALNNGNVIMPVSFTNTGNGTNDGWNLLGNPYASHYDWNAYYDAAANYTNLDATIYIYDANTNAYKSYNASSNVGDLSGGIIPSGAGFMVRATAASPTCTFVNTYRTSTVPTNVFKTDESTTAFRIELVKDSINKDAAFIKYVNDATEELDRFDIEKLNGGVNLSTITKNGTNLTANCKPLKNSGDTIALDIATNQSGRYTFNFENVDAIANNKQVFLVDQFLNQAFDVKLTTKLLFQIDLLREASFKNRFFIMIGSSLIPTALNEVNINPPVAKVYPTLVSANLHIAMQNQNDKSTDVTITDAFGKIIYHHPNQTLENGKATLNLAELKEGLYFVTVEIPGNGLKQTTRFVKQ